MPTEAARDDFPCGELCQPQFWAAKQGTSPTEPVTVFFVNKRRADVAGRQQIVSLRTGVVFRRPRNPSREFPPEMTTAAGLRPVLLYVSQNGPECDERIRWPDSSAAGKSAATCMFPPNHLFRRSATMIMTTPDLVELPALRPRQLETEVTAFRHRLTETGLFTDEALIRFIDTHPREYCNVSVMGKRVDRYEWAEADTSGLSGAELLQAVKNGRMWVNIRRLERYQPEFWQTVEKLYAELERNCSGFITSKHSGNLIISSPTAFVYYHLDVPQNILWHLRGRKRVWVYPLEERFIRSEVLEETVAGRRVEDLPYEKHYDEGAMIFDMEPGDVVTWPQNSPHRVENLEGMNVSLSTEHYTARQLRYVRVCRANQLLKRALKLPCRSHHTEGLGYTLKSSLFLGFRAVQKVVSGKETDYEYPMAYRVDPQAPDGVVALETATEQ